MSKLEFREHIPCTLYALRCAPKQAQDGLQLIDGVPRRLGHGGSYSSEGNEIISVCMKSFHVYMKS